jgi:hypothetical protein
MSSLFKKAMDYKVEGPKTAAGEQLESIAPSARSE